MSPVFSARRRADEFDSLVEAAASGRRVEDARFTDLLDVVATLRTAPAPAARPEFVADLRERLMAAAADELVQASPAAPQRLTITPSRSPRERRLAIAVGGVALVGATTSMAVAAQSALPGDVLYPLKRALENAQTGVRVDDAAKGASLLAIARGRLAEVDELTRSEQGQDIVAIEETLADFAVQTTEASDLLLADYAETGSEASIKDLQDFTAQSLAALEDLSAVLPSVAQEALVQAGELLAQIAQTALSLCPLCGGEQIGRIPSFLVQAVEETLGTLVSPATGGTTAADGGESTRPSGKPSGKPSAGAGEADQPTATPSGPSLLDPPASTGGDGGGTSGGGTSGGGTGGGKDDEPLGGLGDLLGGGTPASGPGAGNPLTDLLEPLLDPVGDLVEDLLNPDAGKK
ncbi:DUF5667 domain-containing protein [Nocardioides sp.]|uniref:DUF5667 domain-containing protein n=1 Tax=Nocardioides sp. TaxID=35761 RepID=UPI002610E503|nr:DUF5667 domain-containing protein [Nocardioides sp.]